MRFSWTCHQLTQATEDGFPIERKSRAKDAKVQARDRLSFLPQELLDMICAYLEPAELILLRMTSGRLLRRVTPRFRNLSAGVADPRDMFLVLCALEEFVSLDAQKQLICALCRKKHPREWFLEEMVGKPGIQRFCRNYEDAISEFASQGLTFETFDQIRSAHNGLKKDSKSSDQRGSGIGSTPIYKGNGIEPEVYSPCPYLVIKDRYRHSTALLGKPFVHQTLRRRSGQYMLTSYLAIRKVESDKLRSRFTSNVPAKIPSALLMTMPRIIQPPQSCFLCPHLRIGHELCRIFRHIYTSGDGVYGQQDHGWKTTCGFCRAVVKIYLNRDQNLIIKVEKDLGPCKDNKDPLFLRHLMDRNYQDWIFRDLRSIGRGEFGSESSSDESELDSEDEEKTPSLTYKSRLLVKGPSQDNEEEETESEYSDASREAESDNDWDSDEFRESRDRNSTSVRRA